MKKLLGIFLSIILLLATSLSPIAVQAASVGTVTSLTITGKTNSSVKLKWKKVKGATGYQVYYSTSKGKGYKKGKTIKKGSTITANISSLKTDKKYYFKVRAVKKKKTGKFSKIVSTKTQKNIVKILSSGSATWTYNSGRGEETFVFVPKEEKVYYTITGRLGEEDSFSYYSVKNNKVTFQLYNKDHYSTETNEISLTSKTNRITVKKKVLFHSDESYETYKYTFTKV